MSRHTQREEAAVGAELKVIVVYLGIVGVGELDAPKAAEDEIAENIVSSRASVQFYAFVGVEPCLVVGEDVEVAAADREPAQAVVGSVVPVKGVGVGVRPDGRPVHRVPAERVELDGVVL